MEGFGLKQKPETPDQFIHFLGGEVLLYPEELYERKNIFLIVYQNKERVILEANSKDDRERWVTELKNAQVLPHFLFFEAVDTGFGSKESKSDIEEKNSQTHGAEFSGSKLKNKLKLHLPSIIALFED